MLWVNKHLQRQICINEKKKERERNIAVCELNFARALVSTVLGGGLCCSAVQIIPGFYVFIHAYSFLASSTKQLRILVCGVILHCYEGQNSILCFVKTPTHHVWRFPGTVLDIGKDQRHRKLKLFASVSQCGKL